MNELVDLQYIVDKTITTDTLHKDAAKYNFTCDGTYCVGSLLDTAKDKPSELEKRIEEARDFLDQYYTSLNKAGSLEHEKRKDEVILSLKNDGTYDMEYDELTFGAKTAWRNAPRCIGRIQWNNLHIQDGRRARTAKDMFEFLCKHLEMATNGGNIKSVITIFSPSTDVSRQYRVWNSQLIQYAGYKSKNGEIIGDPASVELTQECERLGWRGNGGMFDPLPMVLQAGGQEPEYFIIPPELILEVTLRHPEYPWFEKMGLKWYAVPAVANMKLDCGGLEYTACPFNGWYMGTEVGARDLCDVYRYNILPAIGKRMGLDTNISSSLWKDKAMVEVNIAVLHSYQSDRVSIVDHHSASESFLQHVETETEIRGGCPADWVWIVPPLSGSACGVFHKEMLRYKLKPSYEYQDNPHRAYRIRRGSNFNFGGKEKNQLHFRVLAKCILALLTLHKAQKSKGKVVTILYATETGRSLKFANTLKQQLGNICEPKVICMANYDINLLQHEKFLIMVTSTFGNGDPPANGVEFWDKLSDNGVSIKMQHTWYTVLALGSSQYGQFCKFGHDLDLRFQELEAKPLCPLVEADEMKGQKDAFSLWSQNVQFALSHISTNEEVIKTIENQPLFVSRHKKHHRYRFMKCKLLASEKVIESLHGVDLYKAKFSERRCLGNKNTGTYHSTIRSTGKKNPLPYHEPGDHLKIFPRNDSHQVKVVLSRTNIPTSAHNTPFQLECRDTQDDFWSHDEWFPAPISLKQALTYFLDINAPINASDLADFRKSMKNGVSNGYIVNGNVARDPTYFEIIEQLPLRSVEMILLLIYLPILGPRYYSVSSCMKTNANAINVAFKKVTLQGKGNTRGGVCTSYLLRIPIGHEINFAFSAATGFRMSNAGGSPILMIAQGTGIAPFRAFWQYKHWTRTGNAGINKTVGPLYLYYGCRDSHDYFLYKEEIKAMRKYGAIEEFKVAFSRDKRLPKSYVQDILLLDAKHVGHLVTRSNAYVYFCGSIEAWEGVCDILGYILIIAANMSKAESSSYIQKMKSDYRLNKDIFQHEHP